MIDSMTETISDELLNDNIFNRAIFKNTSKDELESNIKYFSDKEEYEKCLVLKELIDNEYYIDNPEESELDKISIIIEDNRNELKELDQISEALKDELNKKENEDKEIKKILDEIDDVTDEIIYSILEVDNLREEFLKQVYEDSINSDLPPIKNQKALELLKKYRSDSIKNIEIVLEKFK